jgi:predicted PurR-regulated permease PerM
MRTFTLISTILKLTGELLIMAASIVNQVIEYATQVNAQSATKIAALSAQVTDLSEQLAEALDNDAADAKAIDAAETAAADAAAKQLIAETAAADANARAESLVAEEAVEEGSEQAAFDAFKTALPLDPAE